MKRNYTNIIWCTHTRWPNSAAIISDLHASKKPKGLALSLPLSFFKQPSFPTFPDMAVLQ
jgi:hypothetical protein